MFFIYKHNKEPHEKSLECENLPFQIRNLRNLDLYKKILKSKGWIGVI